MKRFGIELYAGNWFTIRAACRDLKLEQLRAGLISEGYLLFPEEFCAGDILTLQEAVAVLTCTPVTNIELERDECASCLFADWLTPQWVSTVASLTFADGASLMQQWSQQYFAEERCQPNWQQHVPGPLGSDFIQLCRLSRDRSLDLVMVWNM